MNSHRKSVLDALGRKPIHPFPARMAAGIALDALGKSKRPLRVLDPMAGSGTVLAVARAKGHRAFGIDIDPLAVLLATVWTRTVNTGAAMRAADRVLRRARKGYATLSPGNAYPRGADDETRKFLRYWFDDDARRQLTSLARRIHRVEDGNIRDVLWCGFSRLIITKSSGASLAMDLSHSRPHKTFSRAPVKPFNRFLAAVETVVDNCPHTRAGPVGPATVVKCGDARNLSIPSETIDLVLTSPPYLNAIDYMRCSKFSLVWMGYSVNKLGAIRAGSVGAAAASPRAIGVDWVNAVIGQLGLHSKLSTRDHALLARYVWDMGAALAEVVRVLRLGGRAIYVVGDSTVRGTYVRNSAIVAAVAALNGLTLISKRSRALPANRRYLPPPSKGASRAAMDMRMRQEVVLEFRRT